MIIILCPTVMKNKTYLEREFLWKDDNIIIINPKDKLDIWLKKLRELFENVNTLFIIDDCSATEDINKKRKNLADMAFSGRHDQHSIWVLKSSL